MDCGSPQILIIDNDPAHADHLYHYLTKEHMNATLASSGKAGIALLANHHFDLVIVDTKLPMIDGFELTKQIRERYYTPIILLTSPLLTPRHDDFDSIYGLEIGADDCLAKPINMRSLLAIIRARLRREAYSSKHKSQATIGIGALSVNIAKRAVSYEKCRLELTATEFALIEILALNKGRAVSREAISEQVFKRKFESYDRSIDVHFSNLRKKFSQHFPQKIIKTIHRNGYMLVQ